MRLRSDEVLGLAITAYYAFRFSGPFAARHAGPEAVFPIVGSKLDSVCYPTSSAA